MASSNKISKTFVWILMALLVVGLAGFGATNLSGNIRSIGSVGEKDISVDLYARTLQEDLRALSAQTGQTISFEQAQAFGIQQQTLARVVTARALDHETAALGLSVGDAELQQQIFTMAGFQGIDGKFDRDAYRFALENAGMTEAEFELSLREEAARALVQGAVLSGNAMPAAYTDSLVAFIAERRNATLARLTVSDLDADLPAPSDAELQAYYDANLDAYTQPESKRITYAWLTPDMLGAQVTVDEDMIKARYEERSAELNVPERRLVERIAFASNEDASAAVAALADESKTFETLVTDRGLTLADVDLGDVALDDLGAAGVDVFAANSGDVVGPFETSIGPALFRVNGILAAQNTSYEDARDDLRGELAAERARRIIETQSSDIDDMLAGGATLEDLSKETDMELGQIDWSADAEGDIAGYEAFREAALAVTEDDYPQVAVLDDGAIFAIRLDEVVAPYPLPLAEVSGRVAAGLETQNIRAALRAKAETLKTQIAADTDFAAHDLNAEVLTELLRTGFAEDIPADVIASLFEAEVGDVVIGEDGSTVVIARLDGVLPADESNEDVAALRTRLENEATNGLSQDLFEAFARDIQTRGGLILDQAAINAVHVNFQ